MPGKFNYEVRHKYPHLIGDDTAVWERFILKFPGKFDTVDYDVKVGSGTDPNFIKGDKSGEYWAMLTKKRIDVVGFKNNSVTIIEVKKRVSLSTLGQILGYKFLYLREHPEIPVVSTLIVCSLIDQDDIDVLERYSVNYLIV
ncbi:unnamed protein product [marine sediment metagenome]|uniref:DUF91 domain-containing protein n=1 Tax=marine sediment metagenome TaxID=412755 RepID=X1Q9N7_9ZZZZ